MAHIGAARLDEATPGASNAIALSAVLVDDPAALRALAPEWAELVASSADAAITTHPDWMLPWWEVFGETGRRALRVLAFRDGERLVGLAPLLARRHVYRPGVPFRRLELLASGEDEADETCSDYIGVVAAPGYEAAVAAAFSEALASRAAGAWDEIVLPSMSGSSPLPALLEGELARRGWSVAIEEKSASPYVTLPRTFDEYLALLKGPKRSQLKKALRALEQWGGGAPVLERVRAASELEEGKRVLEALHKERWGSEGVYRSARYRAFHDRVMPRLLERGVLDLGWLNVRGQRVAAFYNLRWNGRVYHYQSGRKLDVPDDVRVGVTMHALLVKDAIDQGMREYDFLAGVSQYKMALAVATRPVVTLRAARPSAVESARRAAESAMQGAKRLRERAKEKLGRTNGASANAAQPAPAREAPRVGRALDPKKTRAIYFGPERALFGYYHAPADPKRVRRAGVVICPPLGYEGICAYPALRTFAERLAAAGHPVLRFDYDGTGDSAGTDADPGRVRAWLDSVGHAAAELRALSGAPEVCLLGVRMGATLALSAAAERGDVHRLVLWNACPSGKAYVREMKAFRMLAEQTGELAPRAREDGDESEESGGFLFTAETLAALKGLDATKLDRRAAEEVLVVSRDDVPEDEKLARAIASRGATTTTRKLGGYAEMMVAPHKSVFPELVAAEVIAWLGEEGGAGAQATAAPAPTARARGVVAPGVVEEPIRFGQGDAFFGVLTEPASGGSRDRPLVIFSNTAGNYRIGPNRMWVEIARKLASHGFSSLRIDVSGIGDSMIWQDEAPNHPYADQLFDDVRAAIAHLRAAGRAERFGVAGLCSGAFVAYHTALRDPAVTSIALVNLQIFAWEEGMSLEVNPLANRDQTEYYKRRLFAKDAWMKMLRGGVDVRNVVGVVRRRVTDSTRAAIAKVKAKLPADPAKGTQRARELDALCKRGVDVFVVFSGGDPGIDNLNVSVGASMKALRKRPELTITTIDGVDHSYTPVWSQVELERVFVEHFRKRFG